MTKKILRRSVADKTREIILKAARRLFAKSGFSGTSTQSIAKAAKVNEALIFHHFGNKSKLWQAVKADVIENIPFEPISTTPNSVREFLEEVIQQRLSVFQQCPELARLLQWQNLEDKQTNLFSGNKLAPNNWLEPINYLQQTGKIKKEIKPEFVMLWLVASVNVVIFGGSEYFEMKKTQEEFIAFLVEGFLGIFS